MWRIRNELDFLIVKNAMLGVRDAIAGQISAMLVLIYFLYPYVPGIYLLLWGVLHFVNYAFRFGINSFYQKLNNSKEHYVIATSLLRFYTLGLAITSLLWGSSILFLSFIPENFHFIFYMLIFGFTFASLMSIGPILSMYLAYTVPMNTAALAHLLLYEESLYLLVAIFIVMGFIYSLRSSKFYFSIYHSLIQEKLNVEKAFQETNKEKRNLQQHLDAIEEIGLGVIITDARNNIIQINSPIRQWFGKIEELPYDEFLSRYVLSQEKHAEHTHITTNTGKVFELNAKKINDNQETLILLKDITQECRNQAIVQKIAQRYKERAEIDALTSIFNRASFIEHLQDVAYEADRSFNKIALLFIDLDNFKSINDTYGHKAGDTVLKIVAKRIRNSLRQSDLLGRYAGDEFVAALKNISDKEVAESITTKLLYTLSQPILLEDRQDKQNEIYVTVSIGISIYPDDTRDLDQLISKADRAMYDIKSKSKNGYEFYDQRSS